MRCTIQLLGVLAMFAAAGQVRAVELITNGTFETGTLAGWTVTDQAGGSGSWFLDDADGFVPFSGLPTVGPAAGLFCAVSDQVGPGTHALEQSFTVPGPALSVILSFDMFVNDYDAGPVVDPAGLDYTAGPNQHARVDIMAAGSAAFDTGGGVLANFFLGVDPPAPNPHPYTPYAFDITALVGGGGTFELRFAEVDNQGNFNQGIDNVSIDFTPVPESSTGMLAALALIGLVGCGLRRHKR